MTLQMKEMLQTNITNENQYLWTQTYLHSTGKQDNLSPSVKRPLVYTEDDPNT